MRLRKPTSATSPSPASDAARRRGPPASRASSSRWSRATRPPGYPIPGPVTAELYGRLTAEDIATTESALEGSALDLWNQTAPEHRMALVLIFGAYYDIPGVLERTGLIRAAPPEDIHAMARGVLALAGDPMLADTVASCFAECSMPIGDSGTLLDFGCSSGRILRVFAALQPGLECIGCDPNVGATEWASEHLPMARFFTSPALPPLDPPHRVGRPRLRDLHLVALRG